jgi:anti-sigma28 factor (negative regulator of flagellin synthesis)
MKVSEIPGIQGVQRGKAVDSTGLESSGSKDRVSVQETKDVEAAVAVVQQAAGGKRAARLEKLEAEVRSGGYRADPSRLAEQILSDAEVDARISAMLNH